jgi:hypothetical protein
MNVPIPGLARTIGAALLALLLTACAAHQKTDAEFVAEQAQARWEALLGNDLEAAYAFYTPGYRSTASMIDFAVYIRTRKVLWTSAEYIDTRCENDRCKVRFNVGFRVSSPVPGISTYDGESAVEETWIRTRGEWWYLPENQ